MRKALVRTGATAAALFLFSSLALPGVIIEYATKQAGAKEDRTGTMWVEKDRLRMQVQGASMIYRGDKQAVWILDEKEGRYMEMTKEQMKKMGEQISGAMAEMQEQLKSLPPEQREMMEKMMSSRMPAGGAKGTAKNEDPRTFTRTGKTETIHGFPCVSYDAVRSGKREQELWVTDWKRLDLTAADFKVLEEFGAFMKDAISPIAKQVSSDFVQKYSDAEKPDAIPGVPIRTVTFHSSGDTVSDLKKISREAIPASMFELPKGLKKEAMEPMGMQGR